MGEQTKQVICLTELRKKNRIQILKEHLTFLHVSMSLGRRSTDEMGPDDLKGHL